MIFSNPEYRFYFGVNLRATTLNVCIPHQDQFLRRQPVSFEKRQVYGGSVGNDGASRVTKRFVQQP